MKHIRLSIVFVLLTALVIFVAPNVWAQPVDAPIGSTLEQRVNQRKAEQKTNLTPKEVTKYQSTCVKSQAAVRDLQTVLGPNISKRVDVYNKVDAKLLIIAGQLRLAGKDTKNLEAARTEYANKVISVTNAMNQYRATLDDLVTIDCKADINGFIALITTARQYHQSIRQQANDIKAYVEGAIKKSLDNHVKELQPKSNAEEKSES